MITIVLCDYELLELLLLLFSGIDLVIQKLKRSANKQSENTEQDNCLWMQS